MPSSSAGVRPSSSTTSTPPGLASAGRSGAATTRAAPWSRSTAPTARPASSERTTVAPVSSTRSTKCATTSSPARDPCSRYARGTTGGTRASASAARMRPSTVSRLPVTYLPPFPERLRRDAGERARPAPRGERTGEPAEAAVPHRRTLEHAGEALRALEPLGAREGPADRPQGAPLDSGPSQRHDLRPLVDEDPWNVDSHRADLGAGTTERGCVGERRGDAALAVQLGLQDRPDRAGVDGRVRVPAGLPVDRADVDAGGAADAPQRGPA